MLLLALALPACRTPDAEKPDPAPDLTVRLGPGEVLAGEIVDEASLAGGIDAEGQIGDFLIYNDRVRFVIAAARDTNYMVRQGGSVIDADIVRPEGQPGRDMVDDWAPMAGLGHVAEPTSVEVIHDGADGRPAVIAVEGTDAAVDIVEGAVEADIVPDLGILFRTVYTLAPDSYFLEVETTITAAGGAVSLPVGDLLITEEAGDLWEPGRGYVGAIGEAPDWAVMVGARNEGAWGLFSAPGQPFAPYPAAALLNDLLEVVATFGAGLEIPAGASASTTRLYGVGPDPAALSGAWLSMQAAAGGVAPQPISGAITDGAGAGIEGARAAILVDGAPYTVAFSGAGGAFEAEAPAGAEVWADGRGTGLALDRPAGAAPYGPYGTSGARAEALASWEGGAIPVPQAEGRGVSAAGSLALAEPGVLVLAAADGLPFEARIARLDGGEIPAWAQPGEGGGALAWARDGAVEVPLEAGRYGVVAWRGVRHELMVMEVEIAAGARAEQAVELAAAYEAPGWVRGDPHMHAAPSSDAGIPMEDRLTVSAGVGIGLHFGTDHDHVVDYGPLVGPMGLAGVLQSVVASEVSPVLRGHLNMYPLTPVAGALNGGAWPWWIERVGSTAEQFGILRAWFPGAVLQLNHPLDSGVGSAASWSEGVIGDGDFWSEDFDALEVNNGGDLAAVAFYHDLTRRGILAAPTGVSDSHGHTSGGPGINLTWFGVGVDDPTAVTADLLVGAVRDRRTVAGRGPFVALSIPPGSEVVGAQVLEAEARSPSWIVVDRMELWRDGALVETVAGAAATFTLDPERDAAYVVVAAGDAPMAPISGDTPWAMTSAILVDADGDGWEPPMPAFEIR